MGWAARVFVKRLRFLGIFFLILFAHSSFAKDKPIEDFDEILITVKIPKFGEREIPAAIYQENVYLSLKDLFDFLHIKYEGTAAISGFILNQYDPYSIDQDLMEIRYQDKVFPLSYEHVIREDDFLYLRSDIFGEVFGLNCAFNFRNLSVTLTTDLDLPVFRLMRQEMIRKNLNKLHGKIDVDTTYARKKSLAKLHFADWAFMSTNLISPQNAEQPMSRAATQTRYNLALGGELAGGEVFANLNAFDGLPIAHRNQFYQWRHVNNDNNLVRQINLGRIHGQSTSTIFAPIVGMQLTNASTLRRKAFGSYRIAQHTEADWMVELYVNNTLIDFVKADASGFFTFDVPLIYGNTNIQLMFYGPFGEVQISDQVINIPFTFLPKNEVEYTLSSGFVDDGLGSMFTKGAINYGVSRRMTIGGGVEYFSSIRSQPFMPFVQSSIKVTDAMLIALDYMPGVTARALMNYRLLANITMDASYTRLDEGQEAIIFNYLEERKLALSMPIRKNNFSLFSRLSITQMVFADGGFTNAQLLLSSRVFGVPTNATTFGIFRGNTTNLHSMVSQSYRLPYKVSFQPQVQYNYAIKSLSNMNLRIEKRVGRLGFLNMFYQRNFLYKNTSLGLGFRYDFSFANVSTQVRHAQDQTLFTTTARGSLIYDATTHHMDFNNKVNVGKGAVTVLPFLDLNNNGKRDKNEPLVKGLKLKVKGGQVQYDKDGEAIRITNLIAYEDYIIELDKDSFDNIAWRVKHTILQVRVDPNQFKKVEVPVQVMGEASGMVFMDETGIGRIKMTYYDAMGKLLHSTFTERDGYYTYMSLPAGDYEVMPDADQLEKLGFYYKAGKTHFTISEDMEGDYIEGLDFVLFRVGNDEKNSPETSSVSHLNSQEIIDLEKKLLLSKTKEKALVQITKESINQNNKTLTGEFEVNKQLEISSVENENGEHQATLDQNDSESKLKSPELHREASRFTLGLTNPALLEAIAFKNEAEQINIVRELELQPLVFSNIESQDKPSEKSLNKHDEANAIMENLEKINSEIIKPNQMKADDVKELDDSETLFKVQILTSPHLMSLKDPVFKKLDVDYYYHKGLYKYTYGATYSYEEAGELKNMLWEAGYKDAFVVSFYKRRRLE